MEESKASIRRSCRSCGSVLPAGALGGNCPACLWSLAFDGRSDPRHAPDRPRRFGAYELLGEIAAGGMGVVWRARQQGLERDVALKMILAGRLASSAQVVRFYAEARAAARLDHPCIVPIYEIGEEEGCLYYTMKLMEGGSLAATLKTGEPMPPRQAARHVAALARGIHFAHQRGVLHRDVKPSNILLDAAGQPRIADFGLARLTDGDSGLSRTGAILGTPAYMAPEQASGRPSEITTAADVYGLGAVLYELLAGVPPFQAGTPLETLRLAADTEPAPLRARAPTVARDLEVICLKCLQKKAESRYATACDLADDLERWLAGEPIQARPVSAAERLFSWCRRKPQLAGSIAAVAITLVAAFCTTLALFFKARHDSEARAVALRAEEGQRLAFQSLAVVGDNPGQALLLALEAAERAASLSTNNALLAALERCRERRRFLGHSASIESVAFSADGRLLVTASQDRTARVWSAGESEALAVLRGHAGAVRSAAFNPEGTSVVTAGDDGTARIWECRAGTELRVLALGERGAAGAAFSPDGSRVLTAAGKSVLLWDAASGRQLAALSGHTAAVLAARFSPDGAQIATGGLDGAARLWDGHNGTLLSTLPAAGVIRDIAYSADGRRVALAAYLEAQVWSTAEPKLESVLRGHSHGIYTVALTSDGSTLATGSEDFTARLWDVESGKELHRFAHGHKVISVGISPDDKLLVTASYDNTARVWGLQQGELVAELNGHAAPLAQAVLSPRGDQVATGCVDFTARLWAVRTLQPLALAARSDLRVVSADVAADGGSVVVAYWRSREAQVLAHPSAGETARLVGHEGEVDVVRFSPDGAAVATGAADSTVRIWKARDGSPLETLSGLRERISHLSFSPDGARCLALSRDGAACVWDLGKGAAARVYRSDSAIGSAAFGPDSDQAALSDFAGNLQVVRLSTGQVERYPPGGFGHITSVDFGPGPGEIALASVTTRAHIRDLPGGAVKATLLHPARVEQVAVSPGRRWLATIASDAVVRVWKAVTGEEWLEIKKPGRAPNRVHFPFGREALVVTWIRPSERDEYLPEVVIYPLDAAGEAHAVKFGELTPDERDHFQVGSAEERREARRRWRGGHIFGKAAQNDP